MPAKAMGGRMAAEAIGSLFSGLGSLPVGRTQTPVLGTEVLILPTAEAGGTAGPFGFYLLGREDSEPGPLPVR